MERFVFFLLKPLALLGMLILMASASIGVVFWPILAHNWWGDSIGHWWATGAGVAIWWVSASAAVAIIESN